MVSLRAERARLLGFETFAAFKLDDTMAKTPENVLGPRRSLAAGARRAAAERDALQAEAQAQGDNIAIEPWDWRYYAERVRKARHDLDEVTIKPFFQLDRIIEAAFETAHRLFGPSRNCRTCPAIIRTSASGRSRAGKASPSGSSSVTISPDPPSAAAPG